MTTDTPAEVEHRHLQLLRQESDEQRLAKALHLTQMVRDLAKQAIAEAHPNLSPQQHAMKFVRIHYGDRVADELRSLIDGPSA